MSNDLPLQIDQAEADASSLETDCGHPVIYVNRQSDHPVVLVCEHAGIAIPSMMGSLGLTPEQLKSHIAWDPGAEKVTRLLAGVLGCAAVIQRYSRLVYDCNRPPDSADAMRETSDGIVISGNRDLPEEERNWRTASIYKPFHEAISQLLDERKERGIDTVLVTIHSFTPLFEGKKRAVEVGILHDEDQRLGSFLLADETFSGGIDMRRNDPYGPQDGVTHTLKLHGISRAIPNVMIEIRNDLIAGAKDQKIWAERIAGALRRALDTNEWR